MQNPALRCMWLIPDGSSFKYQTLDPLLYQELPMIYRRKVPWVLSTHPKFNCFPFCFLPLELSIRDGKNIILKEKAIFLPYSIRVQTFLSFLTLKMKSTSDDGVFIAKKKRSFWCYVYWNPLITELSDSDKCLDNSDYSQGTPRQSNCSFSSQEMWGKKKI